GGWEPPGALQTVRADCYPPLASSPGAPPTLETEARSRVVVLVVWQRPSRRRDLHAVGRPNRISHAGCEPECEPDQHDPRARVEELVEQHPNPPAHEHSGHELDGHPPGCAERAHLRLSPLPLARRCCVALAQPPLQLLKPTGVLVLTGIV